MERAFITWFTPSGPTAVAASVSEARRMFEIAPAMLFTLVRAETFTDLRVPTTSWRLGRGTAGACGWLCRSCCCSCCSAEESSCKRSAVSPPVPPTTWPSRPRPGSKLVSPAKVAGSTACGTSSPWGTVAGYSTPPPLLLLPLGAPLPPPPAPAHAAVKTAVRATMSLVSISAARSAMVRRSCSSAACCIGSLKPDSACCCCGC
mmetsp:Transcript_15525/g.42900  ORF Transcript_15525/g.42900 Transcript_15525/m.42900 type:complete len:204 (-) Transcript_15525:146-757(-)